MKLPGNLGLKASSIKYISTGVAALGVLAFAAQADAADIYAPVGPGSIPSCRASCAVVRLLWRCAYRRSLGGPENHTTWITTGHDSSTFTPSDPLRVA